jgi:hypothetical protein
MRTKKTLASAKALGRLQVVFSNSIPRHVLRMLVNAIALQPRAQPLYFPISIGDAKRFDP